MLKKSAPFLIPALLLLSVSAGANYRLPAPQLEHCEALLLPDSKPASGWDILKRAVSKVDVRDLIFGRGKELSLNDKAIVKASMVSTSAKLEVKGLDSRDSIEINLKDDASRALCLLELPENSSVVLNGTNHIGGLLGGKPGEPRYLLHQRNGRTYRLELDWRSFNSIRVSRELQLSPSMYELAALERQDSGKFEEVYQNLDVALIRNALVSTLVDGQQIRIETRDGKVAFGKLNKTAETIETETAPDGSSTFGKRVTVKFSWGDLSKVSVEKADALPIYDAQQLQSSSAIKAYSTHSDANIEFGTARSALIPGAEVHQFVSVDIGLEKPVVGVLLRGNSLTLMIRDSAGGYADISIDSAKVRATAKGWAVDNSLLSGQEVFVKGYGLGKVLEIGADRSLVLRNENKKIEVPGPKVSEAHLATEEVSAFAKAFEAKEFAVVFNARKISRSSGGDEWSELYYSTAHFIPKRSEGSFSLFEISGSLEKSGGSDGYGSSSSSSVGLPIALAIDQAPIVFRNAILTAAEVMDVIKALPKNANTDGSFRFIRNDDGSFLLAFWLGRSDSYSSFSSRSPTNEDIGNRLLNQFPGLGVGEYRKE